MVRFTEITVLLSDGNTVVHHDVTLKRVVLHHFDTIIGIPLLIQLDEREKLYFDKDILKSWLSDEIDFSELFQELSVFNLYRNIVPIKERSYAFDVGTLWLQKARANLVLANKDLYFKTILDDRFELVK